MTVATTLDYPVPLGAYARAGGWRRWPAIVERLVLALALGLVVLLPLAEIGARLLHTSISGVHAFVQHLTLVVGMLGGALAARKSRLLSLATAALFKGRLAVVSRFVSSAVAATVAFYLALASGRFVRAEQAAGGVLAYGVPFWVFELAIPVGFALVAVWLLYGVAERWTGRLAAAAVVAGLVLVAAHPPVPAASLTIPALLLLVVATILGAPIFALLGGAALILFWGAEVPIAAVTAEHYRLTTNAALPALPLFTLTGYFLAEGRAGRRLIRLFRALVGHLRGGPGLLTAVVCAFFTAFTGASGVTILALGGLLLPVLLAARYSERAALGLVTGTGSLGLLLPPCLPLILYAIIARVDIVAMFVGGVIPGMLLVGLTAAWAVWQAPPSPRGAGRLDWGEVRRALWGAKWELLVPVVAFGSMLSGLATAVEAAALTALYTFAVQAVVHRDLSLGRDIPRVLSECGLLIGSLLLILGAALGFTNYLVDARIPTHALEWVTASIQSPWVFLLLLNLLLIAVGALMDIYSALVIVVPLIVPIGAAFGIDPVHLGIVFLANAELGYLMPPVGENLFIAALRFNKPVAVVFRAALPMAVIFLIAVIIITYVPALTTTLPRLLGL